MRGINRNIVECKADKLAIIMANSFRINRNIVECKGLHQNRKFRHSYGLIETLWNVKSIANSAVSIATTRINRNIVECKVDLPFCDAPKELRINRNIVECKAEIILIESYCRSWD